jgi:NADH-quinone oxidoreductase subunit M
MAVWGVVLGTTYIVWLYYRVALGDVNPGLRGMRLDINAREVATLLPLVAMALVIGLYPESVLGFLRAPVAQILEAVTTSPIELAGGL